MNMCHSFKELWTVWKKWIKWIVLSKKSKLMSEFTNRQTLIYQSVYFDNMNV